MHVCEWAAFLLHASAWGNYEALNLNKCCFHTCMLCFLMTDAQHSLDICQCRGLFVISRNAQALMMCMCEMYNFCRSLRPPLDQFHTALNSFSLMFSDCQYIVCVCFCMYFGSAVMSEKNIVILVLPLVLHSQNRDM